MTEPLADFEAPVGPEESGAMKEIERLSTLEDLRRLMSRYVYNADQQRWEDLASLFTTDGTVLVHHLFSYEIDIESATAARGVWAMEDLIERPASTGPDGKPQFTSMHGFGHYRPRFTKVDGAWKIAELVLTRVRMDLKY
jgi:hypothetical protein